MAYSKNITQNLNKWQLGLYVFKANSIPVQKHKLMYSNLYIVCLFKRFLKPFCDVPSFNKYPYTVWITY